MTTLHTKAPPVASAGVYSLHDFYTLLEKHDWYYQYSDDHSVFMKGEREHQLIRTIARQSHAHRRLLDDWVVHIHGGERKPQLPQEGE